MANSSRQKQKRNSVEFDAAALANLTTKIDKTLAKSADSSRKEKRKTQDGVAGPKTKKRKTGAVVNGSQDKHHDEAGKEARKGPGKKVNKVKKDTRDMRDLKDPKDPKDPNDPKAQEKKKAPKDKQERTGKTTKDVLLEEIRALGGDEEDLELVAGIDSDGDEPVIEPKRNGPINKNLNDELQKFALSLGFQNLPEDHSVNTDEEDGSESEEDWEDANSAGEGPDPEVEAESPELLESHPSKETSKTKKGKTSFEPHPVWHSSVAPLSGSPTDDGAQYSSAIANLKAYAKELLDEDAALYSAGQKSTSNKRFMSTVMSSGTLSDKVSALTLAVQESPVHNVKAIESLVNLASKKSRGQAISALGALVDLLGNGTLLPSDRRLRLFAAQPGLVASLHQHSLAGWKLGQQLPPRMTKAHLIMWEFEDWLKDAYFRIVQLLELCCSDEIEYTRMKALDFVFGLLKDKPEQEANLLRLLVNKLGDREPKIASRASYLLLQLLNIHPGMKAIVVKAVEDEILLRPRQNLRTKYHAINTLNQTILSTRESSIADKLVRIYFDVFMTLLKTGSLESLGTMDAPTEKKPRVEDANEKPSRQRTRPKRPASENAENDAAQKLVSAVLTGVNRAIPFTTTDDQTLEKYLHTLFTITHSSNFNTSVQALMLIQQLAARKHLAVDRFYRTLYESLLDPRLINSSKQAMYLNLLYRSLMNDVDVRRVKAFVKRMLQIANLHQPAFACGILFMLAQLQGSFADLKSMLSQPEDNEDDQEVYRDVDDGSQEVPEAPPMDPKITDRQRARMYDGRKRDPEYSNADKSCLWELTPFFSHFHPSIKIFAANVLQPQKSLPKPELSNHKLMHFLDKFVYKNPKTSDVKHSSIMQPVLAAGTSAQVVVPGKAGGAHPVQVNSASFWNLKQEQVAADDVFFHEYYAQVGKPALAAKAAKKAQKKTDAGSDEEEAEEQIWDALVKSRPDVEGDDDLDDSDVDMEDYDDSEAGLEVDADEAVDGLEDMSDDSGGFEGIFGDDSDEEAGASGSGDEEEEVNDAERAAKPVTEGKWTKARKHKKEMRNLPIFASVDDYADMLADEEDGLDD